LTHLSWAAENEKKINLGKSKAVGFMKASVKDQLNYSFGGQKIPEATSFKHLILSYAET
jgi:hypothetical protein